MIIPEELRHLDEGPRPGELPTGAGLVTAVLEGPSPSDVLARIREVLLAVDRVAVDGWPPDTGTWRSALPAWFVDFCAPEQTPEEAARWLTWWRGLAPEARAAASAQRPWSLADWLHWMDPAERPWFWWDARVVDDRRLEILLQVAGWPSPTGAFEWLAQAAGASATTFD